jgi:serine/threonine-protein kinase
MGEVYRAHDSTLGRDVAIKILPDAWLRDPDRLSRFDREARVLASLNHPNIGAIYSIEDAYDSTEGVAGRALVLELVEGLTLAERLTRRAPGLALQEALDIARQVANALDAAHEKGIVHRDLKPANIKITPAGVVKVLDFGLATYAAPPTGSGSLGAGLASSHVQTVAVGSTGEGLIVGTAAYMSPEQARGLPVDKRTDMWAFGCLVYEMLSGRPPFLGNTVTDTLAFVLEREPNWASLPPDASSGIRRLIERCLVKDPKRRLRDIGDARLEIDAALDAPPSSEVARSAGRPSGMARRWLPALLVTAVVSGLAGWMLGRRSTPVASGSDGVTRLVITPPPGEPLAVDTSAVAVSPDGRRVAYVAGEGGHQRIYMREIDQFTSTPLAGTEGGSNPFFSPDGQWLGFLANGKLRKMSVGGGSPQTITETAQTVSAFAVANWERDDSIYFTPIVGTGIWRVPAAGGMPTTVTTLKSGENSHRWPQLLPGGKALLFSADVPPASQVFVQLLDTGERRSLVKGVAARYLSTGHLVYVQAGTLMAVPFDLARLQLAGTPVAMSSGVMQVGRLRTSTVSNSTPQLSFSTFGTMAYIPANQRTRQAALVWVDRNGAEQQTGASGGSYYQPRLSPDGRRVAVTVGGEDHDDLWLYELARETWSRVTSGGNNAFPLWSPDGRRLAYSSDKAGPDNMYSRSLDGSTGEERLIASEQANYCFSWSRDGVLAYVLPSPRTLQDIWVLRPDQKGNATPFLQTPFGEGAPAFSPDGRWIAYVSNESGRNEVYARPFPGPGEKITVSAEGGNEPVWTRNGRELLYRNADSMMAVDVSTSPSFSTGKPRRLFEKHYEPTLALWPNYDVAIDGRQFLMVKTIGQEEAASQINVVLNWGEELKRLLPPSGH